LLKSFLLELKENAREKWNVEETNLFSLVHTHNSYNVLNKAIVTYKIVKLTTNYT